MTTPRPLLSPWRVRVLLLAAAIAVLPDADAQPASPASAASAAAPCRVDPFAGRALYLRGSFNNWAADERHRFSWACDRHEAVVTAEGEHRFKVGDDAWSADADFGRAPEPAGAPGTTPLALRGGDLPQRFVGTQRVVLTWVGTRPSLRFESCAAPPFGSTTLFLRGGMTSWGAHDEYAFRWRCDAYVLNVKLDGRQEFKIADADWSPATSFGAPAGAAGDTLVRGGDNARRDFAGEHTLTLRFADATRGALTVGPRTLVDERAARVTDPVATSLRFDSRRIADKSPFGAVGEGTTVMFSVRALPGVERGVLVVERRLLEGNQDRLEYTEVARVPLLQRRAGADGLERWTASHRFDAKAVYGWWFEFTIGGQRYVYQNNEDTIHWTRERGSGGLGAVAAMPAETKRIRRFRQTVHDPKFSVPAWAPDVVWYQIFPDRFRNGDPRNDPKPGVDRYHAGTVEFHRNWLDKPWRPGTGDGSDDQHNNDFFGGDLAGIRQKLPYLKSLGVNTLYLTPIFRAPSNHKYDTADYRHVDPAFGRDEDFTALTKAAAKLGIRVVPDTSLNHVGADSPYFDRYGNFRSGGAFENGKVNPASPYASWFRFDTSQADPSRQYKGWGGPDLPEIDKASPDFRRFAYGARDSVMKRWLDRGAAGWRMDVAPWVPDDFWREWRQAVKGHRPDALTVAETWFDASKYFLGDMFDSTMNYIFRNAVLDYAAGGPAAALVTNFEHMREQYPAPAFYALMNLVSSHDQARALRHFGWHDERDPPAVVAKAKQRLKLAAFIQMTWPGAPTIYYGDEVGVAGGDDPYNRATYPWPDLGGRPDDDLLKTFQRLTKLRHEHAVLRRGSVHAPLHVDEHVVVHLRQHGTQWAITAWNNAEAPRRVKLVLPDGPGAWRDALGGPGVRAVDGALELEVPAGFGRVLVATEPVDAPRDKAHRH